MSAGDDITDTKAYSIEEAKQKSAFDRKMKTAEQKKMDERRAIRKLRDEFDRLLQEVLCTRLHPFIYWLTCIQANTENSSFFFCFPHN